MAFNFKKPFGPLARAAGLTESNESIWFNRGVVRAGPTDAAAALDEDMNIMVHVLHEHAAAPELAYARCFPIMIESYAGRARYGYIGADAVASALNSAWLRASEERGNGIVPKAILQFREFSAAMGWPVHPGAKRQSGSTIDDARALSRQIAASARKARGEVDPPTPADKTAAAIVRAGAKARGEYN